MNYLFKFIRNKFCIPGPIKERYLDKTTHIELFGPYDHQETNEIKKLIQDLKIKYQWYGSSKHYNSFSKIPSIIYYPENRRCRVYIGYNYCKQFIWQQERKRFG